MKKNATSRKTATRLALMAMIVGGMATSFALAKRNSNSSNQTSDFSQFNRYSFMHYDASHLQFYGDPGRWNGLFTKMNELVFNGQGRISMMHMGGSHVQGGALTDRLRSNFAKLTYGVEGERGFFFPYQMAGTNSPKTIECKWTGNWKGHRSSLSKDDSMWGMSGITATTTDSIASVRLATLNSDSVYYEYNRVRIYYDATPNTKLLPDPSHLPILIEFNPEMGYVEWTFSQNSTELNFTIERNDSLDGFFTLQGVYFGNGNTGITYNTIGVNGAGTYSYLRCEQFEDQLYSIHPDLVIFAIGVNDANVPRSDFDAKAYESRYDSLVAQFKNANPDVCFLFITNNDTYYQKKYPNSNALEVRNVMQRLAEKYDGAVYDLFEVMGGLGSINAWINQGLAAKDKIHFTRSGYELQGDMIYEAFSQAFGDFLERKNEN